MKFRKILAILLAVASLGGTHLAWAEQDALQQEAAAKEDLNTSSYTDTPVAPATSVDSSQDEATKPQYVTRQDLDALKDLIDEQDKKKWNSGWTVNVSGSLAGGYTSSNNGIGGDGKGGFYVNFASLGLAGNLREDPVDEFDVRYGLSLLWSGQGKDVGATNGGAANSSNSQVQSPALANVFLAVDLHTAKQTLEPFWIGSLTLGQQLIPFGQDNLSTEDQRPTIRTAQYLGNFGIGRDIGLKHDGGFINRYDPGSGTTTPLIGYSLAVWNGSGANRLDNNNEKAYNGRILITPESQYLSLFRGLSFGGSVYKEFVGGNSGLTNPIKEPKEWYGWELSWLRKPFLLTAEGIYGNNPRLAGTVNPAAPVITPASYTGQRHSTDYVATLFWTPGTLPDFQPLYRYDNFLSDSNNNNTRSVIHTIGFNYFVWQTTPVINRTFAATAGNRVLKIQANWNLREAAPNKKFSANDYSVLLVASF
jgi:hypothetical protein